MYSFIRGLVAPSVVLCESAIDRRRRTGSHQYVANRFIEDRVGSSEIDSIQFVTVLDGHGGPQAAEFLTRELPRLFQSQLTTSKSVAEALRHTFLTADQTWFNLVHPVYQ